MTPYELSFLDDKKSLDLLIKKAIPYQEPNEEFPNDLLELAEKLSKKCKGLPLALIEVGGILSTKEQNYHVWERVLRTMDWQSEGKGCMDVLTMSYQDMPYYLKACFLYLASFPEDFEISAKSLIRMWVAEGFIPHEGRKTLEETAENYLEELFQRSMVQVSSRSIYGSIKSCKLHDLLRDLAMHEAGQENFVTVFSPESDVKQPNREIWRVSFQYSPKIKHMSQQSMEYVGRSTRSILMFDFAMPLPNYSNFRLLKVLVLQNCQSNNLLNTKSEVRGLDELVHLKYLGLIYCDPIPKCSFHHMKALEILEIRGNYQELPKRDTLWTIRTLRHVHGGDDIIDGPPSTADLRNLLTLRAVQTLRIWDRELPVLNNLRKLELYNNFDDWVTVTNLLQVLPSMVYLKISSRNTPIPIEIVYPKTLLNYQNLLSLSLGGEWSETVTLDASSFPPHLVRLEFWSTKFKQNPMPELGKLKSLKKLSLQGKCFNYDNPTIFSVGFSVLQYLKANYLKDTDELIVAEGVMPKLTYVHLSPDVTLHLPPELQHVTISFHDG